MRSLRRSGAGTTRAYESDDDDTQQDQGASKRVESRAAQGCEDMSGQQKDTDEHYLQHAKAGDERSREERWQEHAEDM